MHYLISMIITYIILYFLFRHWAKKREDQNRQQQLLLDEQDSFYQSALKDAINFSTALQRINQVKKCSASPLIIRVTSVDSALAKLELHFTIHGVRTLPFVDIENSTGIASGLTSPVFVTDIEPATFLPDMDESKYHQLYHAAHEQILASCCQAIYQDLFNSSQSYFGSYQVYELDFAVTQTPCGDVSILWSTSALRAENYKRNLTQIAARLRQDFPEATITFTYEQITVSFR